MSEPIRKPDHVPESYQPKKPEVLKMAEQIQNNITETPAIKAAAATIKAKARNNVRIIELPACKMVTSGRATWDKAFKPGGTMERFDKWASAHDKTRADAFYSRDFMWGTDDWGEWGCAVTEIPDHIDGLEVIDFPGGLFAVAVSVDGDGKDHDGVRKSMERWVKDSGCFADDVSDTRFRMGHITSPPATKEAMGYEQMDLYFPIRIKGEDEA